MALPETIRPLVWYAAYGSNLSSARFMTYLAGGTPAGKTRRQEGASDPTPPRADRPYILRRTLCFARDAPSWGGGGVAFLGAEEGSDALTYARIYLITVDQLREILAQENNLSPKRGTGLVSDERLTTAEAGARIDTGAGEYGLLLCTGREPVDPAKPAGPTVPVWTFTSPTSVDSDLRAPSDAYLSTICRGLLETFWALPPSVEDEDRGIIRLPLRALETYLADRLGHPRTETLSSQGARHPSETGAQSGCRVRSLMDAQRLALVERHLRDGAERRAKAGEGLARTARPTSDRRGAGKAFIAQLHEDDLCALGLRGRWPLRRLARWVILESVHPRKSVTIRARIHEAEDRSERPDPGEIQMDQKLRQGLGIKRGDPVVVRAPKPKERRLKERRRWPSRLIRWLLRTCGRVQPQLMRVTLSRYEEMEIRVCRIPADGFDVLGLEPGGFVTIESSTARTTLRGLEATDDMIRDWRLLARDWARMPDCHEELDLDRVSPGPDRDLPLILIDQDARDELDVEPCDVVAVYRDLSRLIWRQLRTLGLTFILSASIVIFQLEKLSMGEQFAWFGGAVAFGLLLVLYEIRKQLD